MGINNSIDSSNFINKILEIFELSYIYNIKISKIDFLVSPKNNGFSSTYNCL